MRKTFILCLMMSVLVTTIVGCGKDKDIATGNENIFENNTVITENDNLKENPEEVEISQNSSVAELNTQDDFNGLVQSKGIPLSEMDNEYISNLKNFEEIDTKGIEYCFDNIVLRVGDYSADLIKTDFVNTDEFGKVLGYTEEPQIYKSEEDEYDDNNNYNIHSKIYYLYSEDYLSHSEFYISNKLFDNIEGSYYNDCSVHFYNDWNKENTYISLFGIDKWTTKEEVEQILGTPDDILEGVNLYRYAICVNNIPYWVNISYSEDFQTIFEIDVNLTYTIGEYTKELINIINENIKR